MKAFSSLKPAVCHLNFRMKVTREASLYGQKVTDGGSIVHADLA